MQPIPSDTTDGNCYNGTKNTDLQNFSLRHNHTSTNTQQSVGVGEKGGGVVGDKISMVGEKSGGGVGEKGGLGDSESRPLSIMLPFASDCNNAIINQVNDTLLQQVSFISLLFFIHFLISLFSSHLPLCLLVSYRFCYLFSSLVFSLYLLLLFN